MTRIKEIMNQSIKDRLQCFATGFVQGVQTYGEVSDDWGSIALDGHVFDVNAYADDSLSDDSPALKVGAYLVIDGSSITTEWLELTLLDCEVQP